MTPLVAAVLAFGPRIVADSPSNWVTLPESPMQVELHLYKTGKFEAHEWWTGPQTKPMPNYAMKGTWTQVGGELDLDVKSTYAKFMGSKPRKTMKLAIRSVHLIWTDSLGRVHSLTKTVRRPAKFDFQSIGHLVSRD